MEPGLRGGSCGTTAYQPRPRYQRGDGRRYGPPQCGKHAAWRTCIPDTVNGGDTAPNSANWLNTNYASGPSWRGDLSSGAQLVFDSTNWATPQTVLVTAREDDVYEPNVYGRGQDAYVHHYVVAQDINLQHTYYEDIDVNDVVISVTDNDPAYVLQQDAEIEPIEGQDATDAPELHLRLSSEPMYDVTIYVQSGAFLDSAGAFLPDDEQVVFQDFGQYSVCFDEETGLRSVTDTAVNTGAVGGSQINNCELDGTVTSASTVLTAETDFENHGYAGRFHLHACDISGHYVTPESYKDAMANCAFEPSGTAITDCPDGCIFAAAAGGTCTNPPTRDSADTGHVYDASEAYELPTGWSCTQYSTETACMASGPAEGCAWEDEDYIWTTCECVGYNDHPTGGADGDGADNGRDFGATPGVDGFMSGTGENSGTTYPVCVHVTGTAQDVCEEVDGASAGTTRVWDTGTSGCIDVATNGPVERINDGYGTDVAGSGETPALTEEQCLKTGNTHTAGATAGFCTTKQGSLVNLATEALCLGSGSSLATPVVELAGATGNPTDRGSCVEALQVNSADSADRKSVV